MCRYNLPTSSVSSRTLSTSRPGDTFELGVTSDPVRKTMFFEVDGRTAGYGHYLTRSLYDADGQVVEFFPGDQQRGLDVRVLRSPPAPC